MLFQRTLQSSCYTLNMNSYYSRFVSASLIHLKNWGVWGVFKQKFVSVSGPMPGWSRFVRTLLVEEAPQEMNCRATV